MSYLIKPANYKALLDLKQTELGIKQIKEFFQQNLSSELRLRRVTAPLFVLKGMGINDDLSGTERPVSFPIKDLGDAQAEVVHSLAKWKRLTLADYNIEPGYGIYTDMNAIRADEELGNLHSLYVDQWPSFHKNHLNRIPIQGNHKLLNRSFIRLTSNKNSYKTYCQNNSQCFNSSFHTFIKNILFLSISYYIYE